MGGEWRNGALETVLKEGFFWGNDVSASYFDAAESDMAYYWTKIIAPFLDGVEYRVALDLAAGHGRNSEFLGRCAEQVICVDINPDNISFMQERFRNRHQFSIIQNDGVSLKEIPRGTIDLLYCFDSMVHFDMEIIQTYVRETFDVLRPGGHAFLHCSNYTKNPGGDFRDNPHWRNFFSAEMLLHVSRRAGLVVRKIATTPWGGIDDLDCMALLQRPAT